MVVGPLPSKRTRTLSFFFTLFGAFELSGEEITHHQRGDERSDTKILLWIVAQHVEIELVATINQSGKQFVYSEFFFVGPLADRIHDPPVDQRKKIPSKQIAYPI